MSEIFFAVTVPAQPPIFFAGFFLSSRAIPAIFYDPVPA
jgi:hypothetical protein